MGTTATISVRVFNATPSDIERVEDGLVAALSVQCIDGNIRTETVTTNPETGSKVKVTTNMNVNFSDVDED